jgi:hypothetical protein
VPYLPQGTRHTGRLETRPTGAIGTARPAYALGIQHPNSCSYRCPLGITVSGVPQKARATAIAADTDQCQHRDPGRD